MDSITDSQVLRLCLKKQAKPQIKSNCPRIKNVLDIVLMGLTVFSLANGFLESNRNLEHKVVTASMGNALPFSFSAVLLSFIVRELYSLTVPSTHGGHWVVIDHACWCSNWDWKFYSLNKS